MLFLSKRERERERERDVLCVCERERERDVLCVCVRERERERERYVWCVMSDFCCFWIFFFVVIFVSQPVRSLQTRKKKKFKNNRFQDTKIFSFCFLTFCSFVFVFP